MFVRKHNYIAVRIRFLYVEIASAFLNTVLVRILISNWLHMSFIQIIDGTSRRGEEESWNSEETYCNGSEGCNIFISSQALDFSCSGCCWICLFFQLYG
ncbi:uncharacterized protein LOC131076096 isoform X5 [Cryptomeria japonica]|uniref:uncharacterized protein LOC131076096 isoform X5 n=1 Tax=Cryptomeria japonica TaxID=3369 RepID=UPI0027DA65A6|nr:uncharacterized protein LOC131076096 isoform X5 [Cryptomeria japonica]